MDDIKHPASAYLQALAENEPRWMYQSATQETSRAHAQAALERNSVLLGPLGKETRRRITKAAVASPECLDSPSRMLKEYRAKISSTNKMT